MGMYYGQYRVRSRLYDTKTKVKYYKSRQSAREVFRDLVRNARFGGSGAFEIMLNRVGYSGPAIYHWRADIDDSHQGEKTMKYVIRAVTRTGLEVDKKCPNHIRPLTYFSDCVQRAVERGDESLQLLRVDPSQEELIKSWTRDTNSGNKDTGSERIFKYKIHGLQTAQNGKPHRSNDTFYETEDEAIAQATKYATRSSDPVPMVIYKAIKIVRRDDPPVVIEDVD